MPVRQLDIHLNEKGLVATTDLVHLKGTRIGFEGLTWLKNIFRKTPNMDKSFAQSTALGGLPNLPTLSELVLSELAKLKKVNITPFFVFNGLNVRKLPPFSSDDLRPGKRDKAWENMEAGHVDAAYDIWLKSKSVNHLDCLTQLFKIFEDNHIEFMRAPYSSMAQLVYLESHPKQLVHAICAGSDMLMWDVERVILGFDFEMGTFSYLEKYRVLKDLGDIHPDQFLNICIMAGFDFIETFPPLAQGFTFKNAIEIGCNGYASIESFSDHPGVEGYLEKFTKTFCLIKHHLVLNTEAKVEPLNKEWAPNVIHEILGFRLPDDIYFHMCVSGFLNPQLLNTLNSQIVVEAHPLCRGDCIPYRQCIKSNNLLELKSQTYSQLTYNINPFFHLTSRKISVINWFEPQVDTPIQFIDPSNTLPWINKHKGGKPSISSTSSWINEAKKKLRINSSASDALFILKTIQSFSTKSHQNNNKNHISINPSVLSQHLLPTTQQDLVTMVSASYLELRNIFTKTSLTPLGNSLLSSLNLRHSFPNMNFNNAEELLICIELLKSDCLNAVSLVNPGKELNKEEQYVTLICRVISLIPFTTKAFIDFPGPFNRDLMTFTSFVKVFYKSSRNLLETLCLSFLLNQYTTPDEKKQLDKLICKVSSKLMFSTEPSCALGIVFGSFLNQSLNSKIPKGDIKDMIRNTYAGCSHVEFDVVWMRGVYFWSQVVEFVRVFSASKSHGFVIKKELVDLFSAADNWFKTVI